MAVKLFRSKGQRREVCEGQVDLWQEGLQGDQRREEEMLVHHPQAQQGQVQGHLHLQAGGRLQRAQVQADHRTEEGKVLDW